MEPLPEPADHVLENQRHWNAMAPEWVASGAAAWTRTEPSWGSWGVPDSELTMLAGLEPGHRAVELGCGTGYVSAWMARRGARVTGLDMSIEQLTTARRLAVEHGLDIEFVHGNAEHTPFADASFDFAISEYGAAIWCDPFVWIPEAHRLLAPGGRLVFLGNHPLAIVCSPLDGAQVGETLARSYFDLHRVDWTQVPIDPGGVEFNLPVSRWLELFRDTGFDVEGYHEVRPPADATGVRFTVDASWAHRFPCEQVWKLRKRG
jgi:SAM-dependent methyltransferase